jgi:hypothetical protein
MWRQWPDSASADFTTSSSQQHVLQFMHIRPYLLLYLTHIYVHCSIILQAIGDICGVRGLGDFAIGAQPTTKCAQSTCRSQNVHSKGHLIQHMLNDKLMLFSVASRSITSDFIPGTSIWRMLNLLWLRTILGSFATDSTHLCIYPRLCMGQKDTSGLDYPSSDASSTSSLDFSILG